MIAGQHASSVHVLPERGQVVVGRSRSSSVCITDEAASRRHLRLSIARGRVHIEDLESRNGTLLRRRRLEPGRRFELALGDVVEVGQTMLVLQRATQAGHDVARAAPGMGTWLERLEPLIERLSGSDLSVLVTGETGVGKELVSRMLHDRSARSAGPFVAINCAALPGSLLESELFGYERGAFTGASQAKAGLFEVAHRGTILLDEIGETPIAFQAKLLRVLDTRQVMRVGALKPRTVDARVLAATNRDLQAEVQAGRFRKDLYFRLSGFALSIPPLRERLDEVASLAARFAELDARRTGRAPRVISPAALERLRAHSWPGNVRELKNAIERALVLCDADVVTADHIIIDAPITTRSPESPLDVRSSAQVVAERERIEEALRLAAGNQSRAAERLGMSRRTLLRRIDSLALPRPRKGRSD